MKIVFVIGTRAEVPKMYSCIKECEKRNIKYILIHTWQHYDDNMFWNFLKELNIKQPKYSLERKSNDFTKLVADLASTLIYEKPNIVLVQWDTDSVLAWTLASKIANCKVWHIEAWLRSFDMWMPEEKNRIVTDHLSNYHFCPTEESKENLLREFIVSSHMVVTWNTIVDCLLDMSKDVRYMWWQFIYMTMHRPSNVDNKEKWMSILEKINKLDKRITFACHPRTLNKLWLRYGRLMSNINIIEPVWYIENIKYMLWAEIIITDSWWIQEESCILKKKCIILRDNTERPEAMEVWWSVFFKDIEENLIEWYNNLLNKKVKWYNPFWNGTAWKNIIDMIEYWK